jgi:membrane protease YdiL (CAAX protease family)
VELLVAAILYLVAARWLFLSAHSRTPSGWLAIVGLISIFPIALALFLLIRGYRPGELGIRWRGFGPAPLVMLGFGALTALTEPLTFIWRQNYHEMGSVWQIIKLGVFVAALPEEFLRMVWQTRVGACINNRAVGWFVAALLWSALHAPFLGQSLSLRGTFFAVVRIIPYGLLLGYMTFRTQSILPSVLLHATKFLWGGS